jgi:hypothetical protein
MKTQSLMIATTLATLIATSAFAAAQDVDTSISVDGTAPIRATLLPLVSIDATQATSESNPAAMRIADTAPIEVTLLPTVHVTARQEPTLATTLLPTVRVTPASTALLEAMEVVTSDSGNDLPVIDDATPSTTVEPPLGLRARSMPR